MANAIAADEGYEAHEGTSTMRKLSMDELESTNGGWSIYFGCCGLRISGEGDLTRAAYIAAITEHGGDEWCGGAFAQ